MESALSAVVNLSVPEAVVVDRLHGRAQAEGRSDDRPETILERLRVYSEKTEPLVGFYRDRGFSRTWTVWETSRKSRIGSTRRSGSRTVTGRGRAA